MEMLIFMIPGLLLGLYAQWKLSSTYNHYIQVGVRSGMTGAQAARRILDASGLHSMEVHEVAGRLSDHYDPSKRALFLSSENFHGRSVAAVGVAAHEAGHALQHQAAYAFFGVRMALVKVTQISSMAWQFFILGGLLLGMAKLFLVGILLFGVLVFFQVVTLPVEFDASSRAKKRLLDLGIVAAEEHHGVSKVLNAAAMTYVAAMVSAVMTLLYYLSMFSRSRD